MINLAAGGGGGGVFFYWIGSSICLGRHQPGSVGLRVFEQNVKNVRLVLDSIDTMHACMHACLQAAALLTAGQLQIRPRRCASASFFTTTMFYQRNG